MAKPSFGFYFTVGGLFYIRFFWTCLAYYNRKIPDFSHASYMESGQMEA